MEADVLRGLRAVAAAGLCYDLVVLPHLVAAATYAAQYRATGQPWSSTNGGKPQQLGKGDLS